VSKTDAIRVIVGDGSRVDRDLVRFMLERDGFRVISSVAASEDLGRAAGVMQPDAVVLGDELLDVGGSEAARIVRESCPDAKIVLFSALPAAAAVGPGAPDAVLERGIGLKDLTPALKRLFQPAAGAVAVLAPAAAAAPVTTPAPVTMPPTPPPPADEPKRRPLVVLTAVAASMVLLIFVVARALPSNEAPSRASAPPAPSPAASTGAHNSPSSTTHAPSQPGQAELAAASSTVEDLQQAARSGSWFRVRDLALKLRDERVAAEAAGADVSGLNQQIAAQLAPLADSVAPGVGWALRVALGPIVPPPTAGSNPPPQNGSGGPQPPPTGPTPTPPPPPPTTPPITTPPSTPPSSSGEQTGDGNGGAPSTSPSSALLSDGVDHVGKAPREDRIDRGADNAGSPATSTADTSSASKTRSHDESTPQVDAASACGGGADGEGCDGTAPTEDASATPTPGASTPVADASSSDAGDVSHDANRESTPPPEPGDAAEDGASSDDDADPAVDD
jgi:hypothetical protein